MDGIEFTNSLLVPSKPSDVTGTIVGLWQKIWLVVVYFPPRNPPAAFDQAKPSTTSLLTLLLLLEQVLSIFSIYIISS